MVGIPKEVKVFDTITIGENDQNGTEKQENRPNRLLANSPVPVKMVQKSISRWIPPYKLSVAFRLLLCWSIKWPISATLFRSNRSTMTLDSLIETRYLSTAQVAKALGVSVTTVKRWVDDGVLPACKTAGGHRKLVLADVVRLVREGNLPQADLSRLVADSPSTPVNPIDLLNEMRSAIIANGFELLRSVLHSGYRSGLGLETLSDRVIAPLMHEVGHDWEVGKIGVGHEHRVTQNVVSALYELRAMLRSNAEKHRPVAIGGAPEHDHYILPSLLAKLTLLDGGWDAINLGPHTPMSALRSAIEQLNPQLIWVSVANLAEPPKFIEEYTALYRFAEECGVPVALGGQALTASIRAKLPYTMYGDGFTQLAAFARTIYRRPQQPRRGRPAGSTRSSGDADDSSLTAGPGSEQFVESGPDE